MIIINEISLDSIFLIYFYKILVQELKNLLNMINNITVKFLILILTILLYSGSSYIIFKRNSVIKDKVIEAIILNENTYKELKDLQESNASKLERLNNLKQENIDLRNELNSLF